MPWWNLRAVHSFSKELAATEPMQLAGSGYRTQNCSFFVQGNLAGSCVYISPPKTILAEGTRTLIFPFVLCLTNSVLCTFHFSRRFDGLHEVVEMSNGSLQVTN